ncbi:3-hydroxyacyl-CoA dehydrogenase family protein, partial [Escherichia coli]|uniref:3-hydroxyacyl-CoA dehydrogenase family protein n=1 Tax=Escherichia coli TaxID=562 RepID=UPI00312C7557
VMGVGVAQNLAQTGHQVILLDVSEDIINKAKQQIKNNIRFQSLFQKTENTASPDTILSKIKFSTDYNFLESADFIIENVTEKWDIKNSVYQQIDAICSPNCVFAANTSAISITRIASVTKRPSQVIGMHFMNPVPMKPM